MYMQQACWHGKQAVLNDFLLGLGRQLVAHRGRGVEVQHVVRVRVVTRRRAPTMLYCLGPGAVAVPASPAAHSLNFYSEQVVIILGY